MEALRDALGALQLLEGVGRRKLAQELLALVGHDVGLGVELHDLLERKVLVDCLGHVGTEELLLELHGRNGARVEVDEQDAEVFLAQGLRHRLALEQLTASHVHLEQRLLERGVLTLGLHGATQGARLVEVEVEHGAVDHGGAADVGHVEERLGAHRDGHVEHDDHREAKVEVGVELLLPHHDQQNDHVREDDGDGEESQRAADEGVGCIVGIDDVGEEDREGCQDVERHRDEDQDVLQLRALLGREHEHEQHEDERAHDVAGGAAEVTPDGVVRKLAQPDLDVGDAKLEGL